MLFLPGDHVLDKNITVVNVVRLTMCGESSSGNRATIVCNGSVGLCFTSMVDLKIDSLAFTSCSRKYPTFFSGLFLQSTHYTELVNCSFHDNLGTALAVNNTNITLAGNTEFTHNKATSNWCLGGGIIAGNSNLTFTGNTSFLENNAKFELPSITCEGSGGAIYASPNTVLSFNGTNNFINNSAGIEGGAIYTEINTVLSFNGISNFINNSADYNGGAVYIKENVVLSFNGISNFINNSADNSGGAISVNTNSNLTLNGLVKFVNNVCSGKLYTNGGSVGGGVYMGLKCTFIILPNTTVYWENNHANVGGAIYVRDASPISECALISTLVPKEECFFQLPYQNLSNRIDVQLVFKNNSADVAGSVLYGGAIDHCKLTGLDSYNSGEVFDMIVHNNDTDYNTTSNISSDPLQIFPCEHNHPDSTHAWYVVPRTVYPGETFQVSVVAIGQRNGTVPSTVISSIVRKDSDTNLLDSHYQLQQANNTCTTLSYAVASLSQIVSLELHAERNPCDGELQITVYLNQTCPPGFSISNSAKSCVCEPRLAQYTKNCTITNGVGQITRDSGQQFWAGYDNQFHGLILHPRCPFDYCINHTVVFPLNNTDMQCAYNRSRLLCGACKKGYSLMLGTSHCRQCTNSHLVLLIAFALMGIGLVFLLFVCKLTVATGTLSGLVFYANIVGVNRTTFLPVESININSVLSVFIAWLNLDFGIETCFYNGMDAYSKTWLQFVFPIYIWVLVGLIIRFSHFSHRFAKLLGNNPVSVLATLILLSYTKILRTLIAAIQITYLKYPTYNRMVWLYDANIDYLSSKHIPLLVAAVLVFFVLFLPYTLLLLFGQWLQAISHLRLFSWVKNARLKPFMDSYHAPYKAKHRYWYGLLLVLRFTLLLVFAFNFQEDPKTNLLAILIEVGNFFLWLWITGGVYTNKYVNILEGSFVLNLIILTTVTYCVKLFRGNQLIVEYTWIASVSVAFATFIGILVFQLANVTGITRCLKGKCPALKLAIRNQEVEPSDIDSLPDRLINPGQYEQPFHTHATAGPTEGANEARLITPVYTYGSID